MSILEVVLILTVFAAVLCAGVFYVSVMVYVYDQVQILRDQRRARRR